MIAPINFLWKQLNGPQITSVTKAIYNWVKDSFDSLLNYFNNFSITNATDDHLTTIGTLLGIKRPLVSLQAAQAFFFTEQKETDSTRGFSENKGGVGGTFAVLDSTGMDARYLDAPYYRHLIHSIVESKGYPGSLVLLDDVCASLYDMYRSGEYDYKIQHILKIDKVHHDGTIGDILLYIGKIGDWTNYAYYIDSIMQVLNIYAYAPLPQVFHVFEDSDDSSQ